MDNQEAGSETRCYHTALSPFLLLPPSSAHSIHKDFNPFAVFQILHLDDLAVRARLDLLEETGEIYPGDFGAVPRPNFHPNLHPGQWQVDVDPLAARRQVGDADAEPAARRLRMSARSSIIVSSFF